MHASLLLLAFLSIGLTRSLDGTLVSVDTLRRQLMLHAEGQFQTFAVSRRAAVERESRLGGHRTATMKATVKRIVLADLTPGEYVRVRIDGQERVIHARAVATVERAKVRSASGSSIVLEDGTTLAIGSTLRFVNERGRISAKAAVHPGETILLFRHPRTGNIYRCQRQ